MDDSSHMENDEFDFEYETEYCFNEKDVLQLIQMYKDRPCLYDTTNMDYRSAECRRKAYVEVAKAFNVPVVQVKNKIHSLRNQYRREKLSIQCAQNPKRRKWRFFDLLRFMDPFIISGRLSDAPLPPIENRRKIPERSAKESSDKRKQIVKFENSNRIDDYTEGVMNIDTDQNSHDTDSAQSTSKSSMPIIHKVFTMMSGSDLENAKGSHPIFFQTSGDDQDVVTLIVQNENSNEKTQESVDAPDAEASPNCAEGDSEDGFSASEPPDHDTSQGQNGSSPINSTPRNERGPLRHFKHLPKHLPLRRRQALRAIKSTPLALMEVASAINSAHEERLEVEVRKAEAMEERLQLERTRVSVAESMLQLEKKKLALAEATLAMEKKKLALAESKLQMERRRETTFERLAAAAEKYVSVFK